MEETIGTLASALAKAQSEIKDAELDGINPAFKRNGENTRYATLKSVWKACREPLSKNGLSVVQGLEIGTDGKPSFKTMLMHSSGETLSFVCPLLFDKNNMQGLGSAITYARRYTLACMVGVIDAEDDDGNSASKPKLNLDQIQELGKMIDDTRANKIQIQAGIKSIFGIEARKDILVEDFDTICKYVQTFKVAT